MEGGTAMSASTFTRAALVLTAATAAGALAGWWLGRAPARVELLTVKVPLPVACRQDVPVRPIMPTETLHARPAPVDVDQFTQAAQAELARREGYEIKLLAALNACRAPVASALARPPPVPP
ncbi:hypothetical protein P3G55_24225 [Leptospira sp. 96542]|nr:hypothetical protein [Leptospira sp. 96542]